MTSGGMLTIDPLRVRKGLTLLSLIPEDDQKVSECERRSLIGSPAMRVNSAFLNPIRAPDVLFIAVIERACQSGLYMGDSRFLRGFVSASTERCSVFLLLQSLPWSGSHEGSIFSKELSGALECCSQPR